MLEVFGHTQKAVLKEIFKSRAGLTVDELVSELGITRTAVNQHLNSLKKDGFVSEGELQATAGRPGRRFQLTAKGQDLFPKQYSWFSAMLLSTMKQSQGSKGLTEFLRTTARMITKSLLSEDHKHKSDSEKMKTLVHTMNQLNYDADFRTVDQGYEIEAHNCVYHALAKEHPEVCEFDLELIKLVTNSKVQQTECIVRGGQKCRFHLSAKSSK